MPTSVLYSYQAWWDLHYSFIYETGRFLSGKRTPFFNALTCPPSRLRDGTDVRVLSILSIASKKVTVFSSWVPQDLQDLWSLTMNNATHSSSRPPRLHPHPPPTIMSPKPQSPNRSQPYLILTWESFFSYPTGLSYKRQMWIQTEEQSQDFLEDELKIKHQWIATIYIFTPNHPKIINDDSKLYLFIWMCHDEPQVSLLHWTDFQRFTFLSRKPNYIICL